MKPEYFHYLLEINRHRSISAAAKALHVGQTTLSSVVKSVETELGFPIFQRTPSGVITTPEGERFMVLAWEISVKYENLLRLKTRRDSSVSDRPIRLLVCPSVNIGLSVPLAQSFYTYALRGELIFEEFPRKEIGKLLSQDGANIGVTYLNDQDLELLQKEPIANLRTEVLMSDRFYLFTGSDHPLAGRKTVGVEDLRSERLSAATNFRLGDMNLLGRSVKEFPLQTFYPNLDLMKKAALELKMISVITGYAIFYGGKYDPRSRVIPLDTPGYDNHISICLLSRTDRDLRYQEQILLTCIRNYFHDLPRLSIPDDTGVYADWLAGRGRI